MTIKDLKELLKNFDDNKKIVLNLDNADTAILKKIELELSGNDVELVLKTNIKHQHIYKV
jgi:hypothetical protein